MVVKTRSYYSTKKAQESDGRHSASLSDESIINITASVGADGNTSRGGRRVRITTPSFREASIRTYKLYAPRHIKKTTDYEAEAAAEALVLFQEHEHEQENGEEGAYEYDDDLCWQHSSEEADLDTSSSTSSTTVDTSFVKHTCINPLNPVTQYIYRISVYDIDRTTHLKTAYILYNPKNRLYYVYSIISNQNAGYDRRDSSIEEEPMAAAGAEAMLPEPMNTLQLKFSTYISETIINYIMTLIIPSRDYNYYIQDDLIGVVSSNNHGNNDFEKTAFDNESSFYDIDGILYDKSSTLTTNGFKAFMLLPSRQFWYNYSKTYITNTATVIENNHYTPHALDPIMLILSQSH
jgi:hypothetical protein